MRYLLLLAACSSPASPPIANTQSAAPAIAACDRIAAKVGALPGYFPDCCDESKRRAVIARHCVQHGWSESAIDPCSKANDFFMCLETVGLGDAQRAAWNELVRDIDCALCK
jgi:hypothetical protein